MSGVLPPGSLSVMDPPQCRVPAILTDHDHADIAPVILIPRVDVFGRVAVELLGSAVSVGHDDKRVRLPLVLECPNIDNPSEHDQLSLSMWLSGPATSFRP